MAIKDELNKLKNQDVYSLMLFILFKLRDIPEYSTLSELVYILDKQNLLKLCEYFGGLTLKIPTIEDLEHVIYSLAVYQKVNIDGMLVEDALNSLGCDKSKLKSIKEDYYKICDILSTYSFNN